MLAVIILGSSLAVLAAFAGGSLHQVSSLVESGLDAASVHTGLIVQNVHTPGVTGRAHSRIVKTSGLVPGETATWRADPQRIREKLHTLKGFGHIQVLRHWPNRIIIIVAPRKPAALRHDAQAWAVIDRSGHLIPDARTTDYADLPKLAGLKEGDNIDSILTDLARFPGLAAQLAYATRIHERRWDLVLASGTRLLLPEDSERTHALKLATHLYRHTRLLEGSLERIDLRQPGHLVLRKLRQKKRWSSRSRRLRALPSHEDRLKEA